MAAALRLPPKKRVQLHPGHTRIDDARIGPEYIEKLKTLGYVSIEQVLSVAQMPQVRARLSTYLGADISNVLAAIPKRDVAPQLSIKARTAKYRFGARLKKPVRAVLPHADLSGAEHVPPSITAPPPSASSLGSTPQVNLADRMPPIRDQGNRGTCVAHAAVAAFEHYLIERGEQSREAIDLSEQFLYWNCKANDGDPNDEGTFLEVAMPLLFSDGCCLESIWPYNPNPKPGNEGQGPPPAGAQPDAATRKTPARNSSRQLRCRKSKTNWRAIAAWRSLSPFSMSVGAQKTFVTRVT